MIVLGDILIRDLLRGGLQEVRQDPLLLLDVLPEAARNEMAAWLTQMGEALDANIFLGFPDANARFPCVSIVLASQTEQGQPLGGFLMDDGGMALATSNTYTEYRGAEYGSSWRIAVQAENANLTVWLGAVIKWILLRGRYWLETNGLVEQRIGMTDFEPVPEWMPMFVFTRAVILSATHYDGYQIRTEQPNSVTLTGVFP